MKLRAWQAEALREWERTERGIVEVATGGGKTRFALAAAAGWLARNPSGHVIVLVPTSALQDQWAIEVLDGLPVSHEDVTTSLALAEDSFRVQVLVVNTARRATGLLGSPRLLVADECHRYASTENARALVSSEASLGLTATAEREHDQGLESVLIPRLGPLVYAYSLADARKDGVVNAFDMRNIKVPMLPHEQVEYDGLTVRLGRAVAAGHDDVAKRIAMRRARVVKRMAYRIPVAVRVLDDYRGQRCIVFHEEVDQAEELARLASSRGHSVAVYHSGLGAALRRDNLRQFHRGIVDVLVTCRALDEGVDVPEAQIALVAAASASRRQRIQRLGRVLRVHGTKGRSEVVTLYGTEAERDRLTIESTQFEDVARVVWAEVGAGSA